MDSFVTKYMQKDPAWIINENTSDPQKRNLFEALFTLSNGYLGMRGINEDMPLNTSPGTYLAGAFDKSECMCVEMVNFPNPIPFYFKIDGAKVDLDRAEVLSHQRLLDLKNGAIYRETTFKNGERGTRFRSIRFVCRDNRNAALMIAEITPLNWSGEIKVVSELDGTAHNAFANYFPDEWARHFALVSLNDTYDPDTVMVVKTRDRGHQYCFATYLQIDLSFEQVKRFKKMYGEKIVEEATVQVRAGTPLNITKYIAVEDSRNVAESELVKVTTNILNRNKIVDVATLWEKNKKAWAEKWKISDIKVTTSEGQDELNAKIRFNLYHLLINGSETDYRHGVGIKGFTGEMYRGHYFWDTEMYMFPFYLYNSPIIARNLLVFRHRILDSARKNATTRGFRGALYCWENDEQGNEGINHEIIRETGELRIRETIDQYHTNLAVMYAVYNYYRATNDVEFMINYGADMLIENMRFWDSYLVWNEQKKVYDSLKVMGPDEYHANIDNNYYTNYLFKAIGKITLDFLEECRAIYKNAFYKITNRLAVSEAELNRWQELIEKIYLPETRDGVLEQFEGYFDLEDYTVKKRNEFGIPVVVELEELKDPAHPVYTPDLIAYHEALVRMSKEMTMLKQADTVLLFSILPYDFSEAVIKKTLLFYEERTLHYSSLSPGVYALVAARVNEMEIAKRYFELSLHMDLQDIKKESENALHTPTSGEVYTIITQGFAGLFPNENVLVLKPNLPGNWQMIEFNYFWRGALLSFKLSQNEAIISSKGGREALLSMGGESKRIQPGQTFTLNF